MFKYKFLPFITNVKLIIPNISAVLKFILFMKFIIL